jgi:hypothetical protein
MDRRALEEASPFFTPLILYGLEIRHIFTGVHGFLRKTSAIEHFLLPSDF